MLLIINAVDTGSKYFQVLGDITDQVSAGDYFQVLKSTGNNGVYEIAVVAYASGYSRLTTVEAIPSASADGVISLGVYDIKFSQGTLPGKQPLVITPYGTDTTTSLTFNGAATLNYGERQQENLLHLLENFASDTAPANPTIGQHWYDVTNDVVKTYTGSVWSTDLNIEDGAISFKDPQHTVPGTKYFITATEDVGLEGAGVSLYPAANPTSGVSMFRIVDAAGAEVFVVEYDGTTTTTNNLIVTSTELSSFDGPVVVNAAAVLGVGLTVTGNVAVNDGDVVLSSTKGIKVTGGSSITLDSGIVLRGTNVAAGTTIQTTGGADIVVFGDSVTTFSRPVDFIGLVTAVDVGVSGTASIAIADIDTATVDDLTATDATITNAAITDIDAGAITVTGAAAFNGATTIQQTPTLPSHATNKAYVDGVTDPINEQVQDQLIAIWIGI